MDLKVFPVFITSILIIILFVFDSIIPYRISFILSIQLVFFLVYTIVTKKNELLILLTPSFLAFLYINVNFIVGAYSLDSFNYIEYFFLNTNNYYDFKFINMHTAYFMLCNLILLLLIPSRYKYLRIKDNYKKTNKYKFLVIIFFYVSMIIVFDIIGLDLSFIGGGSGGDFAIVPKTIASLFIVYSLAQRKVKNRLIYYLLIILYFSLTNYDNKRENLYLIIGILLIESWNNNIKYLKVNLRNTLVVSIFAISTVFLILLMTIYRGYGQYDIKNKFEAIYYVDDLLEDDDYLPLLLSLTEAPTFTYNAYNALNFIDVHNVQMSYGLTFFKVFFIFFPRTIIGYKPDSMTSIYTKLESYSFYSEGGSLPINVYSEAYWNFHFAGLVFIGLIFFSLNKIYLLFLKSNRNNIIILCAYLLMYSIGYYRGYGLDLFMVYVIVGTVFWYLFNKIYLSIDRK